MKKEKAESRFRSLSIISILFRVLGYIVIVFGVLAAILAPFSVVGTGVQISAVIVILLATFIQAILYFAFSDIINAILEIDNTAISMRREIRQYIPTTPPKEIEPDMKAAGTGGEKADEQTA